MFNDELKGNIMKKILSLCFFILALSLAYIPMQAQSTIPVAPELVTGVWAFQIDTVKAAAVDTTIIFFTPYRINVTGVYCVASGVDTTISAGHSTTGVDSVVLYKYNPTTQIASTVITSQHVNVSEFATLGTPTSSAVGHLAVGAYYKFKVQVSTNGHLYRLKIHLHYTR